MLGLQIWMLLCGFQFESQMMTVFVVVRLMFRLSVWVERRKQNCWVLGVEEERLVSVKGQFRYGWGQVDGRQEGGRGDQREGGVGSVVLLQITIVIFVFREVRGGLGFRVGQSSLFEFYLVVSCVLSFDIIGGSKRELE